jgi:hypothetical protein
MTRILVTGINSSVNQAFERKLQAEGPSVVGSVSSSKIKTQGLPVDELIVLDPEDEVSFTNIAAGFENFVHIALINGGSGESLLESTKLSLRYLTDRAKQLDVRRLVHISSMSNHGKILTKVVCNNKTVRLSVVVEASKLVNDCFVPLYKSRIKWVELKTPPFRIDSIGAVELGYKPNTTLETINRWMHDTKL